VAGWGWGVSERLWLGRGGCGGESGEGPAAGAGLPCWAARCAGTSVCAGARAREPGRRLRDESVLAALPAPRASM
jgi:hypothetical protein